MMIEKSKLLVRRFCRNDVIRIGPLVFLKQEIEDSGFDLDREIVWYQDMITGDYFIEQDKKE